MEESRGHSDPGSATVDSSSPDEKLLPMGYPLSIFCMDAPEPKYLCSHCKSVLRKPLQTLCGHRYCSACLVWIEQNIKNPICESCTEEDPGSINEESLLSLDKAFCDAAINKEISELSVRCGIPGCKWTGFLKTLEDHQSTCEYVSIPCHVGCGQEMMRKNLVEHLQNDCMNTTLCINCNQRVSGNEYQNSSAIFSKEEECRFSKIGCSFKGNEEERREHDMLAKGVHLLLLLQHIKQLKASLYAAGSVVNSCLTDAKFLKGIVFSLQFQGVLEKFSRLPMYEEEASRQAQWREKAVALLDTKLRVFENIASVLSKEMDASRQKIVASRRQKGLDQDTIRGLELKIADLQRCLVQKDVAIGKFQERLQLSEQASYDGVFLWKITDVYQKCYETVCGKIISLQSPAFYTTLYGYKMCMRLYLNGNGSSRGTHLSLFLVLLKGEYDALLQWPFAHKITFVLIDQNKGDHLVSVLHPDPTSTSFQRPVTDMNEAGGFPTFLPLAQLRSPKYTYVKEGTLFLKCITEPCS